MEGVEVKTVEMRTVEVRGGEGRGGEGTNRTRGLHEGNLDGQDKRPTIKKTPVPLYSCTGHALSWKTTPSKGGDT